MIRVLLMLLLLFVAVSAIPSGIMLVTAPDGSALQMPVSMLEGTPFSNYLIPGIVLCVVVGGSALAALIAILIKHAKARLLAIFAGMMQGGWIVVQMWMLGMVANLQFVYIGAGAAILLLALLWKTK
ncbi:MAG: hypothetical protein ACK4TA_07185 [Saprospiraceae bacterium]